MSGAEQLSQAIMESEVGVVRPNHDLHSQMNSRKERLSFLIKFINDNGVLTKVWFSIWKLWQDLEYPIFARRCHRGVVSVWQQMQRNYMLLISFGFDTMTA